MRFVSHWPLGVPLLFLAPYFPRTRSMATPCTYALRLHRCPSPGWCSAGTRPAGGFPKLFAYTATKLSTGMRNAIWTSEGGCSLLGQLGGRMVAGVIRPTRASRSSFTGRGFSTARLVDGVRRLVGRDRRSHAAFVERVRSYSE